MVVVASRHLVSKPGPRNLITDVAGLKVGNAQDDRIKTGTTVLVGDEPFVAGYHVMGGAPGTRETDLLAPDKSVEAFDALVLSGGSAFGLSAATGVMDSLAKQGRGFAVGDKRVPVVPSAILFDLINGGKKDWTANPYEPLGAEALANASEDFEIGTSGAGTGAQTANLKGGLGSASLVLSNGVTVGALAAVNPIGAVVDKDGCFHAARFELGNEFGGYGIGSSPISYEETCKTKGTTLAEARNTTIAIVATDATLTKAEATRMAIAAHDGMARAIILSHSPMDGDLVFAASTGAKEISSEEKFFLGHAAANCLARAISRGIYTATPAEGDLMPCWKQKFG